MASVQTYVFVDLETTGLPREELNKTRITELSMVAVKRQHLLDTRPGAVPRVQHKLTLCFNPRRLVSDDGARITGLDNDLLEYEPTFNKQVFTMIDTFLSVLTQPVCLIAQNGLNFDYPILQNHLVKLKVTFTDEVLCADCYHGFYHILENKKLISRGEVELNNKVKDQVNENESTASLINATLDDKSLSNDRHVTSSLPPKETISPLSSTPTEIDDVDFYTSNLSMQAINEKTPKTSKTAVQPGRVMKAKRKLFPWGNNPKPSESYKLKDIYERVLNRQAVDAHRAENDCIFALEVSAALAKEFVDWVDKNHVKFCDVKPMTVGVPFGE